MPLVIGPYTIDFPFLLAPMAGITNAPFRLLMRETGAAVVVSELVSATGILYGGRKTLDLCRILDAERPVGLQLFGEDAGHLVAAARHLEKLGADFVDINLGCPVPKVVGKGGGAAMLKNPRRIYDVLSQVQKAITVPLTIKIRTGWDSTSINADEVVAAAADAGVHWVAIHGRTRAQGYEGVADWDLMARVKEKARIPIIANGDVLTAEQAMMRLRTSGCDAVMIGRGALRDPFLFREIAHLHGRATAADGWGYWDLINRHLELLCPIENAFFVGIQLRKFMTWYSAGIEGASRFRKKLYEIPVQDAAGLDVVIRLGRAFFQRPGLAKTRSFLREPFLRGGHG